MKLISNLTLTICVLSAAGAVLLMSVPDRFRRELRSLLSIAAAVSVGAMILHADFSDIPEITGMDFDSRLTSSDALIQQELESRLAEHISALLEEEGIAAKKVTVGTTIDDSRSIFITKASLWLDHADAPLEPRAAAKIKEKIGDIEVKIIYEDS